MLHVRDIHRFYTPSVFVVAVQNREHFSRLDEKDEKKKRNKRRRNKKKEAEKKKRKKRRKRKKNLPRLSIDINEELILFTYLFIPFFLSFSFFFNIIFEIVRFRNDRRCNLTLSNIDICISISMHRYMQVLTMIQRNNFYTERSQSPSCTTFLFPSLRLKRKKKRKKATYSVFFEMIDPLRLIRR